MAYLAIALGLAGCVLFRKHISRIEKYVYYAFIGILWAMLAFRYGQGTDYFAYKYTFSHINSLKDVLLNPNMVHAEIGFRFLCWMFGSHFELFLFVIATFNMLMLHRFAVKYSENRIMTLALFYPTFYLTYYFSAVRQGIVAAVFIGVLLELMIRGDVKKYVFVTVAASLIHASALILLLVPVLLKLSIKSLFKLLCASICAGLLIQWYINAGFPVPSESLRFYWEGRLSLPALASRGVSLALIMILLSQINLQEVSENTQMFIKIFFMGFSVYAVFMGAAIMASRMATYFLLMEVVIVPNLLAKNPRFKYMIMLASLTMMLFMTYKNINSYIGESDYHPGMRPFEYPYVSVFNKEELWKHRESTGNPAFNK